LNLGHAGLRGDGVAAGTAKRNSISRATEHAGSAASVNRPRERKASMFASMI